MKLYNISGKNTITPIKENPYKLEREIQRLFEANLGELMGLELVKSEFTIRDRRIDTLAYDPETKSFVIIEYKRDKNSSVFDQGITYLGLMLNNMADFVLEYNENSKVQLNRKEIDWKQSRVAFVSTDFTTTQIDATNFKDLAIELWQINRYAKDIIAITPIKKSKSAPSLKPITNPTSEVGKVVAAIVVYTEEEHLKNKSEETVELYEKYKRAIINLHSNVEITPLKCYIAFKVENKNICDIEMQRSGFKISINKKLGTLIDPLGIARDISNVGHRGNGDYELKVSDDEQLEYIMSLVKQAI